MLLNPVSLAIVDDHVLFRKILKNYLIEHSKINIVHLESDINDLLEKLRQAPVDLLLMDVPMPGSNGIEALWQIRSECPCLKILVLSTDTDLDRVSDMLDPGIHGYISKSDEPEELLKAIQAIADGRIYRNRIFTEALYWNKQNKIMSSNRRMAVLSERDKKILQLIWEEKSNKEIANELCLGVRSVEKIRQGLKKKIAVKSTVGLLKYAINKGIIMARSISSPTRIFSRKPN